MPSGMCSASASSNSLLSPTKLIVLASLFVIIGPLSLSFYTPAIPHMETAIGADSALMKLSITVYLLGFTICQLICGPMSDRYGRRPVIIGFTAIYIIGCLVVVVGQSPEALIFGRIIQGVGACAGPALSRAMVRDCYQGTEGARLMAAVAMMLSIAPGVAPFIGALLLGSLGWESIFLSMALYGVVVVVVAIFLTPETNRRPSGTALRVSGMVTNYAKIAKDPRFIRLSMAVGTTLGIIFTFSAVLPYLLIDQVGLTPTLFGLVLSLTAVAFFLGSIAAGRMMVRIDSIDLVGIGLIVVLVSAVGMTVALLFVGVTTWTVLCPAMLWCFGTALIMPGGTMGSLAPFGRIAGSAAALLGFVQMGMGVVGSFLASLFGNAVLAQAIVPLSFVLLACALFWGLEGASKRLDAAEVATAKPSRSTAAE